MGLMVTNAALVQIMASLAPKRQQTLSDPGMMAWFGDTYYASLGFDELKWNPPDEVNSFACDLKINKHL